MLDIETKAEVQAQYKLIQIKGGKRLLKFKTTDIKSALNYQKWFVAKYHEGLLMEICPQKKVYDNILKKIIYTFD